MFNSKQACAYLTIASTPGTNRLGGPSREQLRAVGAMPKADRWPVLELFADAVDASMSPAEREAVDFAVAQL